MQDVVCAVKGNDVQRGAHEEQSEDADKQVDRTDCGVDGLGQHGAVHARVEQGGADSEVDDVVQGVYRKDDQIGTLGSEESNSRGDEESNDTHEQVDGSKDGGDQAVGRSAHGPNLPVWPVCIRPVFETPDGALNQRFGPPGAMDGWDRTNFFDVNLVAGDGWRPSSNHCLQSCT